MSDTLIGVIVGGLLTSIPSIIIFWIGKRSEERRHTQEMATKIASDHYGRFRADLERAYPDMIPPPVMFDAFMLHTAQMIDAIGRRNPPTEESLRQSYSMIADIYKSLQKAEDKKGGNKNDT